jgi:hypothetical protein
MKRLQHQRPVSPRSVNQVAMSEDTPLADTISAAAWDADTPLPCHRRPKSDPPATAPLTGVTRWARSAIPAPAS